MENQIKESLKQGSLRPSQDSTTKTLAATLVYGSTWDNTVEILGTS